QSFSGTITNGASQSHLDATQNFSGLGVTTSAEWTGKFSTRLDLRLKSLVRGSVLVGTNTRKSTFTGSPALAAVPNNDISETKTSIVPVGEAYLGVEYRPNV